DVASERDQLVLELREELTDVWGCRFTDRHMRLLPTPAPGTSCTAVHSRSPGRGRPRGGASATGTKPSIGPRVYWRSEELAAPRLRHARHRPLHLLRVRP